MHHADLEPMDVIFPFILVIFVAYQLCINWVNTYYWFMGNCI